MSHNFKAGDLALIIGSASEGSPNIGKMVELQEFLAPGQSFRSPDGKSCRLCGSGAAWLVFGESLQARNIDNGWVPLGLALVESRYLMPLRGDHFLPLTKREEVKA